MSDNILKERIEARIKELDEQVAYHSRQWLEMKNLRNELSLIINPRPIVNSIEKERDDMLPF